MTRVITIFTTGSLQETFMRARETCNPAFERAFNSALDSALSYARAEAPVYSMARWPQFAFYAHHQPPHGMLKASIGKWPIKAHLSGRLFTGDMHALSSYANWVENGIRKHHLTHRPVRGKFFMKKAMDVAFEKKLGSALDSALIETFGGRP